MKKGLKNVVAVLLVFVMLCSLTACSALLRGTYTAKDSIIEQSFTFMEDNRVEMTAFGINVEGDYKIEDGKLTITYSVLGFSYDWVGDFEMKGSSIFIDGVEFVKEK